jgi:Arc/MetJ family transcription regulator
MRTNIDIDDALISDAMRFGPYATKRDAVDAALRLLVQTRKQRKARTLRGKLKWEGSLDEMRGDA